MIKKGMILFLMIAVFSVLGARDYQLDEMERIDVSGVDTIVLYINSPNCLGCFSNFSLDGRIGGGEDRNLLLRLDGDMTSNKAKSVPELLFDRKGNTLEVSLYPDRLTLMGLVSRGNILFSAAIPASFKGELIVRSDSGDLLLESLEDLEKISIRSSSGDVDGVRLSARNIMIDTSSGDQNLKGLYAGESLTIDSSSGDVEFSELVGGEELFVDLSSGDLEGAILDGTRIGIDTSSGDIEVENISGVIAAVKASSGEIGIGRIEAEEILVESHSGDVNLDSVAGYAVVDCSSGSVDVILESTAYGADVQTSSGKITVMVPRDSAYSVDLHTSSGKIRCEDTIIGVVNDDRDEVRGDANGGGGLIRAKASSGNITVGNY